MSERLNIYCTGPEAWMCPEYTKDRKRQCVEWIQGKFMDNGDRKVRGEGTQIIPVIYPFHFILHFNMKQWWEFEGSENIVSCTDALISWISLWLLKVSGVQQGVVRKARQQSRPWREWKLGVWRRRKRLDISRMKLSGSNMKTRK